MTALQTYLAALQTAYGRGDATEHTHRAALQTLIEACATSNKQQIAATNEPKSAQRENKPDYVIRKDAAIIGFVEAKDIGIELKATLKTAQLKRYCEALPNLILTNYVDFVWLVRGEQQLTISLGTVNEKAHKITPAADAPAQWESFIRSFFNEVTPTVDSPKLLAQILGGQTRLLRDLVGELVDIQDGDLTDQYRSFQSLLLPDISPQEFADMYAQTAAYGLFTARVFEFTNLFGEGLSKGEPLPPSQKDAPFSLEKSPYLIPRANPFLRQFFQHIASPDLNPQLRWLIEQIASGLHYVDMDKVLHVQGCKLGFEDPVFHFYESFLAEYDRALRESRGVYYTPEPVVDFIVRGVDWLLKEKLGKPLGLADEDTLILDPAAGTATFLRKVIDHIHATVTTKNAGVWPEYVRERLLPRIFGFELMMAPYTVAHLKLALQLQEQGFTFGKSADATGRMVDERLNVYLTNTLDTIHKQTDAFMSGWIAAENQGAEAVKRSKPVQVVIGNPPYSGVSRNNGAAIQHLLSEYKKEPEGGPLQERNPKLINDDYVKFIRFSHDRIVRTGHGVVAFITNHGWLNNVTFRGMRASIMRDFDDIYILDLHGNTKKQERTPAGLAEQGDDKNVFDIEQGVSIVFMVKINPDEFTLQVCTPKAQYGLAPRKARVHHHELWGSRAWKYGWLHANTLASAPWKRLKPVLPHLLLVPRDDSNLAEYNIFHSILQIMPQNTTGVKTHRDELVFNFTRQALLQKLKILLDPKLSVEAVRQKIFGDKEPLGNYPLGDNRDWSLSEARQKLQKGNSDSFIQNCLYRPFDLRFLAYSDALIDWPRSEIMGNFAHKKANLGLSLGRVGEATGSAVWDVCFVSNCMTEFNLFRRGGNNLFPLWLIQPQGEPIANISPRFLDALVAQGIEPIYTPEDILAYIYAVLHAPSYRARYAEFLKSDFPRLPIAVCDTSTQPFASVWQALLPLGRELVALHLLKQAPDVLQPHYPQTGDNVVEKPRYDEKTQRVYLNTTQYFDGVPPATWAFKVGGYQVCEKWLKDRKARTLSLDDIEHYQKTVAALTRTQTLMQEVDAIAVGTLWPASKS